MNREFKGHEIQGIVPHYNGMAIKVKMHFYVYPTYMYLHRGMLINPHLRSNRLHSLVGVFMVITTVALRPMIEFMRSDAKFPSFFSGDSSIKKQNK
jgi:hypothetical protein